MRTIKIKDFEIGNNNKFALFAGPCVIESEEHLLKVGAKLKRITRELSIPFILKSSFDKANRSSINSYRGPGFIKGLEILNRVKRKLKVPIISDVHETSQVEKAAEVLDVIQIPAFLSRQTDLICAVAKTGKPVNIKKGQFLAPWDIKSVIQKIESCKNRNIIITERGVSFGYNNLIVDMRGLAIMREFGYPVMFDSTHSVQLPGGKGDRSGGQREFAPVLARAATAVGIDALFIETHDSPDEALCDGPNMIYLDDVKKLLTQLIKIDKIIKNY